MAPTRAIASLLATAASSYLALVSAAPVPLPIPTSSVDSISVSSGTCYGGQRLQVFGMGFVTNFHEGGMTISLGVANKHEEGGGVWSKCDVVEGACTVDCGSSSKVVCDTTQFEADHTGLQLDVKVVVSKGNVGAETNFLYGAFRCDSPKHSYTSPSIIGVSPRHVSTNYGPGPPGAVKRPSRFQ